LIQSNHNLIIIVMMSEIKDGRPETNWIQVQSGFTDLAISQSKGILRQILDQASTLIHIHEFMGVY